MWNKWNMADTLLLFEFASGKPTLAQYYSNFAFCLMSLLVKNLYYDGNIYNKMLVFKNQSVHVVIFFNEIST